MPEQDKKCIIRGVFGISAPQSKNAVYAKYKTVDTSI